MQFRGNSIRSLRKILKISASTASTRIVVDISGITSSSFERLGFKHVVKDGDTLIPSCIGPTTIFNAHGKELVRRDLPKIPKTFTFFRTWKDLHGNEHSGIQNQDRDVYARDQIGAPSEKLEILEINSLTYITTRIVQINEESPDAVLHLANLLLECFGEFTVIDAVNATRVGVKLRSVQWDILPPGKYPWSKAKPLLSNHTKSLSLSDQGVIEYRMERITAFDPDFPATGVGGFS